MTIQSLKIYKNEVWVDTEFSFHAYILYTIVNISKILQFSRRDHCYYRQVTTVQQYTLYDANSATDLTSSQGVQWKT
jgi:hypothetical protein